MPPRTPIELFENNQQLVDGVIGYFARKFAAFVQYDELRQWGLIGLWDASRRWDGDEYEFPFYARKRIKGQIIDELRHSGNFIRQLSNEEQPKFTDISYVQLSDKTLPTADRTTQVRRELHKVEVALQALSTREICVVLLYFMEDVNLREIAAQLGITEARACQIKTEAVNKLRKVVDTSLWDA